MSTEKKAALPTSKLVTFSQGLSGGTVTVYLTKPNDPSEPENIRFALSEDDKFARLVANKDLPPMFGKGATAKDSNALIKQLATTQVVPKIINDGKKYVLLRWSFGRDDYFEVRVPWIGDADEGDPEPEDKELAEELKRLHELPAKMPTKDTLPN